MRNLAPATLTPGPRFNVFAGDNGQGKTNLLEAIYAVCTLRSFRTQRLADIVQHGAEAAYIGASVEGGGLVREYELTQAQRSRRVRLDGKAVRPLSAYFGDFNVVLFAPEDMFVPRGSPADRRRFLDRAIFASDPAYLSVAQEYEKALKNRNAFLRKAEGRLPAGGEELLAVYDEQVASRGSAVLRYRTAFVHRMREPLQAAFAAITRASPIVSVEYGLSIPGGDPSEYETQLLAALVEVRRRDLARGHTTVGPHRDELLFALDEHPVATYASQGQLRAIILAWKTAELDLLAARLGDDPILLLDDVSSELDPTRNGYLFEFLRGRTNQCFITTTHPSYVLLESDRCNYTVIGGNISPPDAG